MTGELGKYWLDANPMAHFPQGIVFLEKWGGKAIQEVVKVITMQTAPPFSPEPYCLHSGFINTVSFNSLILDFGSLEDCLKEKKTDAQP